MTLKPRGLTCTIRGASLDSWFLQPRRKTPERLSQVFAVSCVVGIPKVWGTAMVSGRAARFSGVDLHGDKLPACSPNPDSGENISQTDPLQQAAKGWALRGIRATTTSFRGDSRGLPIAAVRSGEGGVIPRWLTICVGGRRASNSRKPFCSGSGGKTVSGTELVEWWQFLRRQIWKTTHS